jgi:hypothetical protein
MNISPNMLLQEISLCQSESLDPCVLILLGDKYGKLKLPEKVSKKEYDLIEIEMTKSNNEIEMFRRFYKIDENGDLETYHLANLYQTQSVLDSVSFFFFLFSIDVLNFVLKYRMNRN